MINSLFPYPRDECSVEHADGTPAGRTPAGGRRDYKLAVKGPLPTSFGEDLYYRLEETDPCP